MKRILLMFLLALCSFVLIAPEADARRMGGGRSIGKQSEMVNRNAARPPAAPATPQATPANPAGKRSFMAPLAGLAAGLGLAALASWLGFGEELATMMLIALLAFAVLIAVRMFMARRAAGNGAAGNRPAWAGAGANGGQAALRQGAQPEHRGYDARWPAGAAAGAAAADAASSLPAGFDSEKFLHNAKVYFVRLQTAFDQKAVDDLREFTSPEMFAELNLELLKRGDAPQTTDVVKLDARMIGVEREGAAEIASVRFSGMIREAADAAAEPFEELWNFSRPLNQPGGWVLAGIQQVA
ncbi:MAG: Tim44 domain-containing protein [Lautropia sp.]